MFRMPTCNLENFTEDEQEIIRPLLDHKNKLRTHKPPFITKDQEYVYVSLIFNLLNFDTEFIVPYQSVQDKVFNPFWEQPVTELIKTLEFEITFLFTLVHKFIKYSTLKVF